MEIWIFVIMVFPILIFFVLSVNKTQKQRDIFNKDKENAKKLKSEFWDPGSLLFKHEMMKDINEKWLKPETLKIVSADLPRLCSKILVEEVVSRKQNHPTANLTKRKDVSEKKNNNSTHENSNNNNSSKEEVLEQQSRQLVIPKVTDIFPKLFENKETQPETTNESIEDSLYKVVSQLGTTIDTPETFKIIETAWSEKVHGQTTELAGRFRSFLEVPEIQRSKTTQVLRLVTQAILSAAVLRMKAIISDQNGLRYRDLRGAWFISILISDLYIVVTHEKQEQSYDENRFRFTWRLSLIIDRKTASKLHMFSLQIIDINFCNNPSQTDKETIFSVLEPFTSGKPLTQSEDNKK